MLASGVRLGFAMLASRELQIVVWAQVSRTIIHGRSGIALDKLGTCRWTLYPGVVQNWDTLGGGFVYRFICREYVVCGLCLFLLLTYEESVQTDRHIDLWRRMEI